MMLKQFHGFVTISFALAATSVMAMEGDNIGGLELEPLNFFSGDSTNPNTHTSYSNDSRDDDSSDDPKLCRFAKQNGKISMIVINLRAPINYLMCIKMTTDSMSSTASR